MATDKQIDEPKPSPGVRSGASPRWLRIAETVVVVAAVIGIVVVGISAVASWAELLSPAKPAAASSEPSTVTAAGPDFPFPRDFESLLSAGFWQAAGNSPRIAIRPVHGAEVEAAFKEFLDQSPRFAGSALDAQASATVLKPLRKNLRTSPFAKGKLLYTIASDQNRLAIVAQGEGAAETVVAGCAAVRAKDGDTWVLLEILPALQTPAVPEYTHLLPLPPQAARECCRTDLEGRLTLELVSLPDSPDALVEGWKHTGWKVEPMTDGDRAVRGYLCSHPCAVVYAFSLVEENKAPRLLMLNMSALSTTYLPSGQKP